MATIIAAPFAPVGPAYSGSSTTQQAVVAGGLVVFETQVGLAYTIGIRLRVSAGTAAWMEGIVSEYSGTTLTLSVDRSSGLGSYSSWTINLAGEQGSAQNYVSSIVNGDLSESNANGAVTYSLRSLTGDPSTSDPVILNFCDGTSVAVTNVLTITVPNGIQLGTANAVPFRVWIVVINDNGVIRLGAFQSRNNTTNGITSFPPNGIMNPTQFGNAAGLVYIGLITVLAPTQFLVLGCAEYDAGLTTAGIWNIAPTRLVLYGPGILLPCEKVQIEFTATGNSANTSSTVPWDDTPPQNNEGASFLSQSISPRSAMSVLEIEAQGIFVTGVNAGAAAWIAKTDVASALASTWQASSTAQNMLVFARRHAGTSSLQTFQLRAGTQTGAVPVGFNGTTDGARFMGGSFASYLRITELQT